MKIALLALVLALSRLAHAGRECADFLEKAIAENSVSHSKQGLSRREDLRAFATAQELSAIMEMAKNEDSFQCGVEGCDSRAHALAFYIEQKFAVRTSKLLIRPGKMPVVIANEAGTYFESPNYHIVLTLLVKQEQNVESYVIDYPFYLTAIPLKKWAENLGLESSKVVAESLNTTSLHPLMPSQSWSIDLLEEALSRLRDRRSLETAARKRMELDRLLTDALKQESFRVAWMHPIFRSTWIEHRRLINFEFHENWDKQYQKIRENELIAYWLWKRASVDQRVEISSYLTHFALYLDNLQGAFFRERVAVILGRAWPSIQDIPQTMIQEANRKPFFYRFRKGEAWFALESRQESDSVDPEHAQKNRKLPNLRARLIQFVQYKVSVEPFYKLDRHEELAIENALASQSDREKYRMLLDAFYPWEAKRLMRSGLVHQE